MRMVSTVKRISVIGSFIVGIAALPVSAHHAFTAEFDMNKPVNIQGTVTKVEWLNPHVWFYIDVKDPSGTINNWGIEMGSPNGLMRTG